MRCLLSILLVVCAGSQAVPEATDVDFVVSVLARSVTASDKVERDKAIGYLSNISSRKVVMEALTHEKALLVEKLARLDEVITSFNTATLRVLVDADGSLMYRGGKYEADALLKKLARDVDAKNPASIIEIDASVHAPSGKTMELMQALGKLKVARLSWATHLDKQRGPDSAKSDSK